MKSVRFFILIIVLIQYICISCTESFDLDIERNNERSIGTKTLIGDKYSVSLDQALYYASIYEPHKEILSIAAYGNDPEPTLYIVNYNSGFLILSGDTRISPVIAYCSSDALYLDQTKNQNILTWLELISNSIMVLKSSDFVPQDNSIIMMWAIVSSIINNGVDYPGYSRTKSYSETFWCKHYTGMTISHSFDRDVDHLLQTEWGTMSPWNEVFPYVYYSGRAYEPSVGYVTTAVSQVLYYSHFAYGVPNALYHSVSYSGSLSNGQTIVWNKANLTPLSSRWLSMPQHSSGTHTSYVSEFMADVSGQAGTRFYYNGSTGALTAGLLSSYGVTGANIRSTYSSDVTISNLNDRKPIILSYDSGNNTKAWVVDGYASNKDTYTYSYVWDQVTFEIEEREDVVDDINNFYYSVDEALQLYPNIYVGMPTTEEWTYSDPDKKLMMNWCEDGDNNNGYFSMIYNSSSWGVSTPSIMIYDISVN